MSGALRLCGRGLPVEPGQPGEIIGEIGQANLGAGADHADCADDQAKPAFLCSKDVLDTGSHPSAGGVAPGRGGRHLPTPRLLALTGGTPAGSLQTTPRPNTPTKSYPYPRIP